MLALAPGFPSPVLGRPRLSFAPPSATGSSLSRLYARASPRRSVRARAAMRCCSRSARTRRMVCGARTRISGAQWSCSCAMQSGRGRAIDGSPRDAEWAISSSRALEVRWMNHPRAEILTLRASVKTAKSIRPNSPCRASRRRMPSRPLHSPQSRPSRQRQHLCLRRFSTRL